MQDHDPHPYQVRVLNADLELLEWCKKNLPEHEWGFWLEMDPDTGADLSTFAFACESTAMQFALLINTN